MTRDDLTVTVIPVKVAHHHRHADRPADRSRASAEPAIRNANIRRSLCEPTVLRRFIRKILNRLRIESLHVELKDERLCRSSDIRAVTETFARRTIRLHTH